MAAMPAPTNRPAPAALDDTSKAIIEQLQRDGRMPYGSIGKAVGLSEAAVRQRVARMIEAGVMQIVAVTDPRQLGFAREAMIAVRVDGDIEQVATEIEAMDEVIYVVVTTGGFDLLVEVVCIDDEHLYEVIHRRIRATAGVRDTDTFIYLQTRKQTYNWGTR
jgi:Lrp/AsnC family transcriptional regulator for asnA, asnC and gidA